MDWAKRNKCSNWLIFLLSLLTEHLFFVLYFSRMFNLPFLKATVSDIQALSCQNYFWALALIGNVLAIVGGFTTIAITDTNNTTATSTILDASDIIVVNAFLLIIGLILFKKVKEVWETP